MWYVVHSKDWSEPNRTEPNRSELIFCYNTLGLYITNNNQESQVEGKTKRVSFFSLPYLLYSLTPVYIYCVLSCLYWGTVGSA